MAKKKASSHTPTCPESKARAYGPLVILEIAKAANTYERQEGEAVRSQPRRGSRQAGPEGTAGEAPRGTAGQRRRPPVILPPRGAS